VNLSKEIKIGLIVILAVFLFFYGFNFLKGKNIFTHRTKFYAIYDNVGGLTESNPVSIRGFNVGQVNKIFFLEGHADKIVVEITMKENSLKIPKDTKAKIFSTSVLGGMGISLEFGSQNTYLENGDTLISDVEKGLMDKASDELAPVKQKAEHLIVTVDSLIENVNKIFDTNTKGNLRSTIKNLDEISLKINGLVDSQTVTLKAITDNVNNIIQNIKNNNKELDRAIDNFANISDSLSKANLAATVNNANMALKQFDEVMTKINEGKGSIGMLVNDKALYTNLENSSKDLDKLIVDLKENPSRYIHFSVFGKKAKK
jgi:phospholipid/cholesterol/gamma-HCH transport system substrate-binding protein